MEIILLFAFNTLKTYINLLLSEKTLNANNINILSNMSTCLQYTTR